MSVGTRLIGCEMLSCAMCGGEAGLFIMDVWTYGKYGSRCQGCGAAGPFRNLNKNQVMDSWNRMQALLKQGTLNQKYHEFVDATDPTQYGISWRSHLPVSQSGKVSFVPVDDILFLKADRKYTTIKTLDKEYLTAEPLIDLESEFKERFMRISRKCLIPRAKLRGFKRNSEAAGWVAIVNGLVEKLPVSRRLWSQLREIKFPPTGSKSL